jgi:hypothetical protein
MRIIPIIGGVLFRVPEGKTIDIRNRKYEGPVHLHLQSSNWYLDEEVFPEPNQFIPERWLSKYGVKDIGETVEEEGLGHYAVSPFARKVFRPFGHGQHMCLGMVLARIVMKMNIFCFCSTNRSLSFDPSSTKLVYGIFPERQVKDGFPATVMAAID